MHVIQYSAAVKVTNSLTNSLIDRHPVDINLLTSLAVRNL